MSNATAECGVCFDPNYKFKVLKCGHKFCSHCCETMQKLGQPDADSASNTSTDSDNELEIVVHQMVIECPHCRMLTDVPHSGVEGLMSNFLGCIMCYQCDTEKLTKEFRWCHTCSRSVCSTCFIDKHANADGTFHEASKWDSNMAARAAVSQLKQMSLNHNQITAKCKADVTNYLRGLNDHLNSKIDEADRASQDVFATLVTEIEQVYGLKPNEPIPSAGSIPESNFYSALNEATAVAQMKLPNNKLVSVGFQHFPYDQLASCFVKSNASPPSLSGYHLLSNLQSKIISTEFIGLDIIGSPLDLAVISRNQAVIVATTGIYHYCNSVCKLITIQRSPNDKGTAAVTAKTRVLVMPNNTDQVMVTGLLKMYVLLAKTGNAKLKQWRKSDGTCSWVLPADAANVVASSDHAYTISHNRLYVYDNNDWLDFCPDSTTFANDLAELRYVQEKANSTDFYVSGNTPRQLDVLQFDKATSRLVSWRCVNMNLLCPDVVLDSPQICSCGIPDSYAVLDRKSTKIFSWNVKTNAFTMIADFCTKSPQMMEFHGCHLYAILFDGKMSRIERITL